MSVDLLAVRIKALTSDNQGQQPAKITLPVRPLLASSLSSRYIRTIPAADPSEAVPVYRLQAINALLTHLARLDSSFTVERIRPVSQLEKNSPALEELHRQLLAQLNRRKPFTAGLLPPSGFALDLSL